MLILIITGCGGGGGGENDITTIEKGPYSDYYGLQIGATLTYDYSEYDSENTPTDSSGTLTYKILGEYSTGIYQTGYKYSGESDFTSGGYIEKNTDGNYYERGDWENSSDYWEESPYDVIISNPVSIGSTGEWWGEAIRQETVTVPAGTFKAWVFHYYESGTYTDDTGSEIEYVDDEYTYFVPYLFIIKRSGLSTTNGVTTESFTFALTSYSADTSSTSIVISSNIKSQAITSSNSSKILKRLFKHRP